MRELIRRTVVLQAAGVGSTLVQALTGVLMARWLQPERYGQYALAFSVASVSSVFIGSAITDAITPFFTRAFARGDREGLHATVGFFARFLFVCALVTIGLVLLLPTITSHFYGNATIGGYAGVIVIASIFSTTLFCLTQLSLQVTGHIRSLALLTFSDVLVRYSAMLGLVGVGFGVWGAVSGHLVGAIVMLCIAAFMYVRLEVAQPLLPRLRTLVHAGRHASWRPLLKPTLWVLGDSNFAMLYGALPVALVGLHSAGVELAYFKLAFGYLMLAMGVMGPMSTVMNVHFPTLQTTAPVDLRRQFIRVTLAAVALSMAITGVILFVAPWVFALLYGETYLPAVRYVYGFALFGALFGLGVGLGPMWRALGKVHTSIFINMIVLGVGVPLGLFLIARWQLWGAVAMVTIWYTLSHAISFIYLMRALSPSNTSDRMGGHV